MNDATGSGSDGPSPRSWLERIADLLGGGPSNQDELRAVLREAADRHVLDDEVLNIMFGALQVAEMRARDVLIPRSRVVCVGVDASARQVLPVVIDSQHSRFPVIGDSIDDVRGILHAKDLLQVRQAGEGADINLRDLIRPVHRIPESKRLNKLLQEFRISHNHMAVVVDEYGHTSGVVTIEDVLEQIVGDIEDEHDVGEESSIRAVADGRFLVKATTEIEDFNTHFCASVDDDDYDTIGGVVLGAFGRVPERGNSVVIDRFKFAVLNADGRRIHLLEVSPASAADIPVD